MERDRLSRKLAVILHADVVGSTLLVQKNETLAHERIQAAFNSFSETIAAYGGNAHEIRGDALVAEFNRASDAVPAAIAFQALNEESNYVLNDDIQPQLRIGISLGEVIIADNTITGAGVVLAQRLEQLAKSGGVVVQGSVSETVPTRMPFGFESLGKQMLKGFEQPVRAYSASLRAGEELPAAEESPAPRLAEQDHSQASSILSPESYEALMGERLEIPDKPSIAVLPFHNMSGDPDQEYFADGMSEDIITALSRVPDLIVIARNSTFVYKGRAVDVRQVGQELGVRHVLEGSIRKGGDRIRITAQLVDAQNGDHVWAERYDRKLDDIFAVQDEISRSIVTELQVNLGLGEFSRIFSSGTDSIEAWQLCMQAGRIVEAYSRDDLVYARKLTMQALELDENYSSAWINLGWIYWEESVFHWSSDSEESMDNAFDAVQKAIQADENNPECYSLLGNIFMVRGDYDQAIALCEKAVEIAPNNSFSVALLANVLIDNGRIKEGIQKMKRAIRLSPFPPGWYFNLIGVAYHLNGENEIAIPAIEHAIQRDPGSHFPRVWLVSALVEVKNLDEALAISKVILEIEPGFSVARWATGYKSAAHARLKDNLLVAGLPE
jgi:adenylate cyclase